MIRTVIQALEDLLDPRVVQRGPLVLREDDPGSTCEPITIEKSERVVALRFSDWEYRTGMHIPVNRWLFPLLNVKSSSNSACKSCDYIIFHTSKDANLFVMLIADYLLNVVKLHGSVQTWPAETHYRGVIFAGDSPGVKALTRPSAGASYRVDSRCKDLEVTSLRPGRSYPLQYLCTRAP